MADGASLERYDPYAKGYSGCKESGSRYTSMNFPEDPSVAVSRLTSLNHDIEDVCLTDPSGANVPASASTKTYTLPTFSSQMRQRKPDPILVNIRAMYSRQRLSKSLRRTGS